MVGQFRVIASGRLARLLEPSDEFGMCANVDDGARNPAVVMHSHEGLAPVADERLGLAVEAVGLGNDEKNARVQVGPQVGGATVLRPR